MRYFLKYPKYSTTLMLVDYLDKLSSVDGIYEYNIDSKKIIFTRDENNIRELLIFSEDETEVYDSYATVEYTEHKYKNKLLKEYM
jgi:hypothetical protein